eukprot:CAMPEP_0174701774 /NCGR_PEP_ID=MMETSP1094-20130205/6303_1 /TAXON_ID=156173 /ORGANISM="Chrysochromulina brevifilum, Strain UTEX LB 985" /LENGTH=52 /DNA_ID=CAMNT_0015899469 /DNA_START=167 /DNA_END=325 /DNA_ORIENTATION=+
MSCWQLNTTDLIVIISVSSRLSFSSVVMSLKEAAAVPKGGGGILATPISSWG